MNSSSELARNLDYIDSQLALASDQNVSLIQLPENFAQMPIRRSEQHIEQPGKGVVQDFLVRKAAQYGISIIAGSVPIKVGDKAKPFARTLFVEPENGMIARYDKIHLFDVDLPDKQSYKESASYAAGEVDAGKNTESTNSNLVVVKWSQPSTALRPDSLRIGLSICYDLRFPELYRRLTDLGAQLVTVPSAFTYTTGKAHWRTLLRARAIENQVYIMAAAQVGVHDNGRETWGHSMIVDPWGKVVAELGPDGDDQSPLTGLVIADIDVSELESIRTRFPALTHRRLRF